MKQFLNGLFWSLGSLGLGLGIGMYLGVAVNTVATWSVISIVSLVASAVFYVAGLILTIVMVRAAKRRNSQSVNIQKKDFILVAGETYRVQKRGQVRPGEYKVIATDEDHKAFNLRVNDYVKEYRHNSTLVLVEGDTISARSGNVILR